MIFTHEFPRLYEKKTSLIVELNRIQVVHNVSSSE